MPHLAVFQSYRDIEKVIMQRTQFKFEKISVSGGNQIWDHLGQQPSPYSTDGSEFKVIHRSITRKNFVN